MPSPQARREEEEKFSFEINADVSIISLELHVSFQGSPSWLPSGII